MKLRAPTATAAAVGGYIAGSACIAVGAGLLMGLGAGLIVAGFGLFALSHQIMRGIANDG